MKSVHSVAIAALFSFAAAACAQEAALLPETSIPIVFTKTIDAAKVHNGDIVTGKTLQPITLTSGKGVPKGAAVLGHIVRAEAFHFNPTHYAVQAQSELSILFDRIVTPSGEIPVHLAIRAMADPVTSSEALAPKASDMDSLGTTTQVGGDLVTPSQEEVLSARGDVVGYRRNTGVYAHLIASRRLGIACNGTTSEQAVGIFSASACGLYGFDGAALSDNSGIITLSSSHYTPKIWANTTALLQVQDEANKAIAAR